MKKVLSFFLASFLALGVIFGGEQLVLGPGGSGGAYAADCVKVRVNGKVVCIYGKRKVTTKKSMKFGGGNPFIGGLVGGLAGSVIGNLVTRPGPTTVIVHDRGPDLEPWTPEWYDYCANRYRSFDPRTGYYWTYNGYKRFCR